MRCNNSSTYVGTTRCHLYIRTFMLFCSNNSPPKTGLEEHFAKVAVFALETLL